MKWLAELPARRTTNIFFAPHIREGNFATSDRLFKSATEAADGKCGDAWRSYHIELSKTAEIAKTSHADK
jgi:hypothetical protein